MSTEFLSLPGAVEGAGADAGASAHYGNPLREQRALAEGEAVVDLSHRSVLSISGEDRLRVLHSAAGYALNGGSGDSSELVFSAATGRVDYAAHVVDDGVALWLLLPRDAASRLSARLDSAVHPGRVAASDRTAEFAIIGAMGTLALPFAAPNGTAIRWSDPWPLAPSVTGWPWSEGLVARGELPTLAARVSRRELRAAGSLAVEALRIAAGRPRFTTELDEKGIEPSRRLVLLQLDGSEGVLPEPDDEVAWDGRIVGRVTSAGLHYELGPIALATIERGTDPTAALTVASGAVVLAAVQEIIGPSSGSSDAGASARERRPEAR